MEPPLPPALEAPLPPVFDDSLDVSNIPRDISNAISAAILIISNKIKEQYPSIPPLDIDGRPSLESVGNIINQVHEQLNLYGNNIPTRDDYMLFFVPLMKFIKLQFIFNLTYHKARIRYNTLIRIKKDYNKECYEIIVYIQLIKKRCKYSNTKYNTRAINKSQLQWNALDICCNYYMNIHKFNKKKHKELQTRKALLFEKWNSHNIILRDYYIKKYEKN